ncbi:MAG TPA: FimV/HubP family polar landmark protein, partial [Lysobacter sp.]
GAAHPAPDARARDDEAATATGMLEGGRPVPASPMPAPPAGNERIELAQAYIELGDHDSARQLLGEVVVNGDHASRQYATRLLRDLDAP